MEELLKVLHYIGIPGGLGALIWKFAPISNFTADIVETKLFSKEKRFLLRSIKYLISSFILSVFTFIFVDFVINSLDDVPLIAALSLLIINFLLFILLVLTTSFNNVGYNLAKNLIKILRMKWIVKCVFFIKKQSIINKLLFFIFYALLTYSSIGLYISFIYFESVLSLGIWDKELDYVLGILSFLFSLLLFPPLMKPALGLIDLDKGKQTVYIEDEEIQSKRWYILYPIQKNYVLLGNKKEEFLCTEKKLVVKEKILNKVIYLEK